MMYKRGKNILGHTDLNSFLNITVKKLSTLHNFHVPIPKSLDFSSMKAIDIDFLDKHYVQLSM